MNVLTFQIRVRIVLILEVYAKRTIRVLSYVTLKRKFFGRFSRNVLKSTTLFTPQRTNLDREIAASLLHYF